MKKRLVIIAIITIFIDLFSKFLVFKHISYGSSKIIINGFFTIFPVKNTGAAFSFLDNNNLLLILISLVILFYLIYSIRKQKSSFLFDLSYALLIGGLIGNLFDRVFLSYVRDFLSFKIFNYNFAIFNVADIAIVVGAIFLFILMVKGSSKDEN